MSADESRKVVLDRIRASLGATSANRERHAAVERRLQRHPRGTIPARAEGTPAQHIALFTEMLSRQGADVRRVAIGKEAVAAIASYLGTCNLPPRLRMGNDPALAALPWREAWDIERYFGPAEPGDGATLSHAAAGAAETGTLFLVSGSDNPTSLNLLPEAHTDFVLALIGEELGLIGTVLIVLLFALFVAKGFQVANRARVPFGRYLGMGITLLIGVQALVNAGVVTGLLPTKGLTLPFVSYGGSSLVASLLAVGILLSISRDRHGGRESVGVKSGRV